MIRSNTKSPLRHGLLALAMGGALVAGFSAQAGTNAVSAWESHKREEAAKQAKQADSPPPAAPQQAQPQGRAPRNGGGGNWGTSDGGRPAVVGPPRGRQGDAYRGGGYQGGRDRGGAYQGGGYTRIVPPSRGYAGRAPRYIGALPPGHRAYEWRGSPYYYGGGHWYRPYGSRFVIVGAPVGLFVSSLSGYSTIWVGGERYYYADGAYYTYEPVRRGYVVARSPYGDDEDDYDVDGSDGGNRADAGRDQDIFIYPMRGQNEQQQADDRYACHKWSVDQTHYDPTDSSYDRSERTEYDRALTACLTGRGYSVK